MCNKLCFHNKRFLLLFCYFIQWRIFYCALHRNDIRCFNYINILRLGTLNNNKQILKLTHSFLFIRTHTPFLSHTNNSSHSLNEKFGKFYYISESKVFRVNSRWKCILSANKFWIQVELDSIFCTLFEESLN